MKKHFTIIVFLAFICLLTSCLNNLMQKAYITNPPNICFFDTVKTAKIKFVGNFSYIENQFSFNLSKKFGISSNLLLGTRKQYGGDIGLIYYKRFLTNKYFENSIGYGYFNSSNHFKGSVNESLILWGPYYYQNINCAYHKLFFQPSFFITNNKNDIGFTFRVSLPYYKNYYSAYSISPYQGEEKHNPLEYSTLRLNNKLGLTFEPIITIRFKNKNLKPYLQFGMCFSAENVYSNDSLKNVSNGPQYIHYSGMQAFPLHAYFFINYCIEFSLKKK